MHTKRKVNKHLEDTNQGFCLTNYVFYSLDLFEFYHQSRI